MRCPACGRDNEEGRPFCAGCAEELVPGAAAQVEPPRAGGPLARRLHAAARPVTGAWASIAGSGPGRVARRALLVLAAVVPGLAHLITGHRRWGSVLLTAFLMAIAAGWWLVGTRYGSIVVMALSALVFVSVVEASRMDLTTYRPRPANWWDLVLALGLMISVFGGVLVLVNARWERVRVTVPTVRLAPAADPAGHMRQATTVFGAGDGILFRRSAYRRAPPKRGDIVRVDTNGMSQIHRILAVPGDRLAMRDERLYLNGARMPARAYPIQAGQPHWGAFPLPDWSHRLGDGEYAVWGYRQPYPRGGVGPVVIVKEAIVSKAWAVYAPLKRRRVIDHSDPRTPEVRRHQ